MSWGNPKWDVDTETSLVDGLFGHSDYNGSKRRKKKSKQIPHEPMTGSQSYGRFVRLPQDDPNAKDNSEKLSLGKSAKRKHSEHNFSCVKKVKRTNSFENDITLEKKNAKLKVVETSISSKKKRKMEMSRKLEVNQYQGASNFTPDNKNSDHTKTKKLVYNKKSGIKINRKQKLKNETTSLKVGGSHLKLNTRNAAANDKCHEVVKVTDNTNLDKSVGASGFQEKLKLPYKINKLRQYLKKRLGPPVSEITKKSPSEELRDRMIKKLQASHFRYLNEQMYNSRSEDSMKLFQKDISAFKAYHEGYQQQVAQWPLNPLNVIINSLRKKPESTVIADFGCGEALLAQSLPKHKVHSFDYVATSDLVTPCDMAHTPLANGSVDVVVFCLSLMGTNLGSYLIEANRVLKENGLLMVAEVESRIESVETFINALKSFGFSNTWKDLSHKIFYFLYFKKVKIVKKSNKLPQITLKPCLYKRR